MLAAAQGVAEAVTGDIIPADQVSKEKKMSRETLTHLFHKSTDPEASLKLEKLWQEYEDKQTESAELVHDAEKLHRLSQAFTYARRYTNLDFSDFKEDAMHINNDSIKREAQEVLKEWKSWEQRQHTFVFVIGTRPLNMKISGQALLT